MYVCAYLGGVQVFKYLNTITVMIHGMDDVNQGGKKLIVEEREGGGRRPGGREGGREGGGNDPCMDDVNR